MRDRFRAEGENTLSLNMIEIGASTVFSHKNMLTSSVSAAIFIYLRYADSWI